LFQNSLPWQRGLVAVEFVWRHSIARSRKPPVIRKDLGDISYISRVIADFVKNFAAMATGVRRSRNCLASFNSPTPKPPCYTKRSRGYLLYRPSYSRFCPKFVAMATGVGCSRICLASFNSLTPNPLIYAKISGDISYIGRLIADFVPNFVAMATGVGCSKICLASFNSPIPNIPRYTQRYRGCLLYKPSYCRFCP